MIRSKFGVSCRLPLSLAVIAALALVGCNQQPTPTTPETDTSAVAEPVEPTVPAADTQVPSGLSTDPLATELVELEESARSMDAKASGLCSFDKINGESFAGESPALVTDPAAFVVSGWVGDKRTMSRPEATLRITQVDGGRTWAIGAGPGTGRADVAQHFDDDGLADAGFEVAADLASLPPGEYALTLIHEDGGLVECDKGTRILIEG